MAYAFRNPGVFGAAASYSGAIDMLQGGTPMGIQSILVSQGLGAYDLWGNEYANRFRWMSHNPADNVEALRGVELYVSCGNGQPGPLDPPGQEYEAHEASSLESSRSFTDRLRQQGIAVTTNYYGNGTHAWERELHASWPTLARGWASRRRTCSGRAAAGRPGTHPREHATSKIVVLGGCERQARVALHESAEQLVDLGEHVDAELDA